MPPAHPDKIPNLVYADSEGEIKDLPGIFMAGRAGKYLLKPEPHELIPLPEGSELFVLPGRRPVGIDPLTDSPLPVERINQNSGKGNCPDMLAVAAFMAPAYTAIHSAAYEKTGPEVKPLPLFAYTAVGWYHGRFWVSAFRSDPDMRQEVRRFQPGKIKTRTEKGLKANPGNRLIQHLGKCSLSYGCPAAINYFMGKWEAPLPTSPVCNARCVGCISLQPSGCCPSTQERIKFVPTANEISDVAITHLKNAPGAVASFGQGCEGEPLLQAKTIEKAIRLIRRQTGRGTINLNTNASLPGKVERLAHAGLDSMRVSLNSARPEFHQRYYRPRGFGLADVLASIKTMKNKGRFVSLNYFILPGFTDDPDEFAALCRLIEGYGPDLIQLRNLNMDPEWYLATVDYNPDSKPLGILKWLNELRNNFPDLKFGYFNPPLH